MTATTNTMLVAGTVATNTTGAFFLTRSVVGTASCAFASGVASVGLIALPAIPSSQVVFGMIIVAATATAFALAFASAGKSIPARMAMIAITTKSSIRVKPFCRFIFDPLYPKPSTTNVTDDFLICLILT